MGCILFCRPNHDNTLNYLHHYSKELVSLAKSSRHKTIDREGSKVTQKEILKIIEKKNPNFIMFNGHGSPTSILGHKDSPLILLGKNHHCLSGDIVYSFSCSSGLSLGRESVKGKLKCFIGYDLDFALGKDPDSQAVPKRDKVAKLFLEPSNILVSSIISGFDVENSIIKAKEKMIDNVWYLSTTKDFLEASYFAPFLFGNYVGLKAHGDILTSI